MTRDEELTDPIGFLLVVGKAYERNLEGITLHDLVWEGSSKVRKALGVFPRMSLAQIDAHEALLKSVEQVHDYFPPADWPELLAALITGNGLLVRLLEAEILHRAEDLKGCVLSKELLAAWNPKADPTH